MGLLTLLRKLKKTDQEARLLVYVVDSADRRRLEETAVELQQLLDEEKLS
eukprot:gene32711-39546_t